MRKKTHPASRAARRPRAGGPGDLVPVAWRLQEAAKKFGVGLTELVQLRGELNPAQRAHLVCALSNSLEALLPGCRLLAVAPSRRKPMRLADVAARLEQGRR